MKKSKIRAFAMALLCFGACAAVNAAGASEKSASAPAAEGKVFNIAVWNEEFQSRFKDYFEKAGLIPEGVKVNWFVTPNLDSAYQNKLDEMLLKQNKVSQDEKIDMFMVEADYALKYVDTPYTLDVKKVIGLTDEDLSKQYKYTKDIMTDSKGVLKGVSWQACPGGFIYRRSIAKAVLGTDDPAEVQKALKDWNSFNSVAVKAKAKGYFMLSGYDDAFRVFADNIKTPFVKDNKINIDVNMKNWIWQTKTFTENGYNNKANLWSTESFKGAAKDGKVFGYFGPAWFIDFCLAPATLDDQTAEKKLGNGSYGDWAFCKGPQGVSWGGTWICAAAGSDNIKLIHDVMYTLTCNKDVMIKIAEEMGDFTNNEDAMEVVAKSSYQNPFLGGQNHVALFLDSAKSISKSNSTPYDQGITESLYHSFADYISGEIDEATAWNNFYTSVLELYPNLSK